MTAEISPAVRLPWAILSPNRVFGAYSSEIWIGLRSPVIPAKRKTSSSEITLVISAASPTLYMRSPAVLRMEDGTARELRPFIPLAELSKTYITIVPEIYFCNDRAKHFFHRRLYQKRHMRRGRGLSAWKREAETRSGPFSRPGASVERSTPSGSRCTTPSWPRNSLASRWARPRRWRSRPESPFTRTCRCGASRRSTPPRGRRTPCSPRPRASLFPWPADRKGTRRRRTGSSIRPDPFYASIPRIRIRRAFFRVRPSRGRFVYEG